jgi:uncharacterized protein (TIGR02996 family)
MIRYEKAGRFWEIAVHGRRVITCHGVVGKDGKPTEKALADEAEARKECEKRVRATEKKGYERVLYGGEEAQPGNPELEQAIAADPRSDGGYLVYADWLQARGDPRGELAVLQHSLAQEPGQRKVEKSIAALLKDKGAYFVPPRMAEMLRKRRGKGKHEAGYCELEWRCGFIHRARVGRNSPKPPYTLRELTTMLLRHPSARLLCELTVGALGTKDLAHDYQQVVQAIADTELPSLRRLELCALDPEQCEIDAVVLGAVGGLSRALPNLEQLSLRAGDKLTLYGLRFPKLGALELEAAEMDTPMRALAQALSDLPGLERLTLRFARRAGRAAAAKALFQALCAAPLTELGLVESENTGELMAALLETELPAQLRRLDLTGGTLTDNQIKRLLEAGQGLSLTWLGLEGNYLTESLEADLDRLATEVVFGTQRRRPVAGLNEDRVRRFAGTSKAMAAARKLADVKLWQAVGLDHGTLWGQYTGSSHYEVFARVEANDGACTCPSFRHPCKHVVALLLMAAQGQEIPEQPAPAGLVDRCEAERYSSAWE